MSYRRLSFERGFAPLCRLRLVGSRQSAVGSKCAFGAVIGISVYWHIGDKVKALYTGLKSYLQKFALRSNAPKFKIQHPKSIIKSVAMQRQPKSFTIHHSPFIIRKRSFHFRFLIPHSSFLIFAEGEPCFG
ncbi:hypothetical protein [Nitratifractor sp.]|uniref:hypothetical protein n=1 Tax=Nitratifractor sp. TaxID=2268144 RepID=UPI0025D46F29|nr:hypothetical protein [Nitratifractor sp.]